MPLYPVMESYPHMTKHEILLYILSLLETSFTPWAFKLASFDLVLQNLGGDKEPLNTK